MRMRASPGPGVGVGRSRRVRTSAEPVVRICMACMVVDARVQHTFDAWIATTLQQKDQYQLETGNLLAFSLDRFAALKQRKANMAKRTCPNIVPKI